MDIQPATMDRVDEQTSYRHIQDYKDCSIFQDRTDGYFVAFDSNGEQISREGALKLVRADIDRWLN